MDFVLNPLGISAGTLFCVGRNYAAHAKEMKAEVPSTPAIFLKPNSALARTGWRIVLPLLSKQVDHEVEIVVALGRGGKDVAVSAAMDLVAGYAVGIDVTARDLQEQAKAAALPWTVSKGFDTFAPVSDFLTRSEAGEGPFSFTLSVNGEVRQKGSTESMLFSVPQLIHHLSTIFTLSPGDLIFTGTPAGVGPLKKGDTVSAEMGGGRRKLELKVS